MRETTYLKKTLVNAADSAATPTGLGLHPAAYEARHVGEAFRLATVITLDQRERLDEENDL